MLGWLMRLRVRGFVEGVLVFLGVFCLFFCFEGSFFMEFCGLIFFFMVFILGLGI